MRLRIRNMPKNSGTEKPWERQPKESLKAYEAFKKYLDLGDERSIRRVAEELHKSYPLIGRWSRTWNWVNRSREYDNELRRQDLKAKKKEILKMQERQLGIAMLLQKKGTEALSKINLDEMYAKDIAKFIIEGAKLERELRKETVTETTENSTAGTNMSLADTIVSAYKRRMEESENDQ